MEKKKSKTREYIESILVAALIALVVRSFVIQAYKIPSGSMEPTLLVGDHLLVNRMSYVIKMPVTDTILFSTGKPKRGDIVVFPVPGRSQ
jgi:signal peptidase I